jgi:hypothetical protein
MAHERIRAQAVCETSLQGEFAQTAFIPPFRSGSIWDLPELTTACLPDPGPPDAGMPLAQKQHAKKNEPGLGQIFSTQGG